jgi:hypothetical protein
MNGTESLILQGVQLAIDRLSLEVAQQREEARSRGKYEGLPEWLDLEQAVTLKRGLCPRKMRVVDDEPLPGGASISAYRCRQFLQPCCGKNYRLVGGRRCWRKEDVIEWLGVTDEELGEYADKHESALPDIYQKRGRGDPPQRSKNGTG